MLCVSPFFCCLNLNYARTVGTGVLECPLLGIRNDKGRPLVKCKIDQSLRHLRDTSLAPKEAGLKLLPSFAMQKPQPSLTWTPCDVDKYIQNWETVRRGRRTLQERLGEPLWRGIDWRSIPQWWRRIGAKIKIKSKKKQDYRFLKWTPFSSQKIKKGKTSYGIIKP